ncbi:biopolymer transporter ExbD [Cellvibrio sp. PSBB023]|uniref:ExbD/TolR family protein n=1 Tax=Cellvibrio sp. PSBB023 TaxID=1945512 RepID=UPI00098EE59A|nr:biopolymer transporter ExbD [Cellvibrio sp. PSBB023]AQT61200.1 biopolymer transporter ExbD [Cellvibrio sp. PSBB023]
MKFIRKKNMHDVVELNITAFMNLMVMLVPFLLVTAVFSRMTVLELNLPVLDQAQKNSTDKVDLMLELVVRETSFDIQDANLGLIHKIERTGTQDNWTLFSKVMREIKSRFPEERDMLLLFESKITYKTMIEVMDHVRSMEVVNLATVESVELFPNISISGDVDIIATDIETIPAPLDEHAQ